VIGDLALLSNVRLYLPGIGDVKAKWHRTLPVDAVIKTVSAKREAAAGPRRHQRRDFHHKVARDLVGRYGRIAVEHFNVKGLAGGMLARSIQDACWSQVRSIFSPLPATSTRPCDRSVAVCQ
jgi:hypothetical protein